VGPSRRGLFLQTAHIGIDLLLQKKLFIRPVMVLIPRPASHITHSP
jgi:hypothetical protein